MLLPDKVQIKNLTKQLQPAFVPATPGVATEMRIPGFGITKANQVKRVSIIRGLSPVQNQWTATFTNNVGTVAANTKVYFKVSIETTNREFRLARPEYEFGQTFTYEIAVNTGDTPTEQAAKLVDTINGETSNPRNRDFLITAESAAGVVTLTVAQPEGYSKFFRGTFIDGIVATTETGETTGDVTVAFAETVPANRGIGYGADVEFKEKLQNSNLTTGYYFDNQEVPVEDALYTQIAWDIDINRPHPKDPTLGDVATNILYIKEDAALAGATDDIIEFFLTDPETRFAAATPITVGFNEAAAITLATSPTAGQLDSDVVTAISISGGAVDAAAAKYVEVSTLDGVTIDAVSSASLLAYVKTNA